MKFSSPFLLSWPLVFFASTGSFVVIWVARFIRHRQLHSQLPSPDFTWLMGNAVAYGKALQKFPRDAYSHIVPHTLARKYGFRGLYYVDVYPFSQPLAVLLDPAVVAQAQNYPRAPQASSFFAGIIGTKSLFTVKDREWKAQRSWYKVAFSQRHIMTLVPEIIEEMLVFNKRLMEYAISGETLKVNSAIQELTMDVITRTLLGVSLHSQPKRHEFNVYFFKAIEWLDSQTNGFNALRKWFYYQMRLYYGRKMDRILKEIVLEELGRIATESTDKPAKTVFELSLHGYLNDHGKVWEQGRLSLDAEFLRVSMDNVKFFLLAGTDTTSSGISMTLKLLSEHSTVLAKLRSEHEEFFTGSVERTAELLQADPSLIKQLRYTYAVVRESLRLLPVAMYAKDAPPGATVNFEGKSYPIGGHTLLFLPVHMHRDPALFDNPLEFDPDRWVTPGRASTENFWAFSKGPQNCLGQELAMIESVLALVFTVRFLDFDPNYPPDAIDLPTWGGKAYQTQGATANPKDGIPMKLYLRKAI